MESKSTPTILVVGGTGKTGRRIVERLTARVLPVRVGSRAGTPPFDWENDRTWAGALNGVDAVYLNYYPDLAMPGAVDAVRRLTDLARERGVARVVLLSGRGEDEAQRAEQVVRDSRLSWTIVRCAWFMQNFSESYFRDPITAGELALPAGDVGEPFVDADDIADVAVAALTDPRHTRQLYELTGPRLLSFEQAVAEIAAATGRAIRYLRITPAQYSAGMKDAGVPSDVVALVDYLFDTVLDGRNAHLNDGVQRALGRAPRDFADYARAAAAAGAWSDR